MGRSERGATGIDVAGGIIIFIISSVAIVSFYYQIYVTTVMTKVHEVAIGYIVDIFEKIDLESYSSITDAKVKQLIEDSGMNADFNEEKNKSHVESSVTNYATKEGLDKDIIKIVNITVVYTVAGNEVTYPINKVKIKE